MARRTALVAFILVLFLAHGAPSARGGGGKDPWSGTWHSSFSMLELKQDGKKVTGSYGNQGQFKIDGKVHGDTCAFTYTEGQVVGKGEWVLEEAGNAFTGKITMANGRPRDWNGWRPDPAAEKGRGKYEGTWLTDLGLMSLEQQGQKVKGRFGARGGSVIEGKLEGRRLRFGYQVFRSGEGWFDEAKNGKTFAGAASDHGAHGWFGWKGRRAPEYEHHVTLKAGTIVGGATDNMLSYRVRAPDEYKAGSKKWPCILILHGSNMNAQAYVNTLASVWKDLAKDHIILGINGERPSYLGKPPAKSGKPEKGSFPSFNYTYVNWMGKSTYKGYPGTDKESPALVAAAMEELREIYPISKYLVGGHSQGGYLTYVLLMHFPELIAGAFPIAGGVIIQAEPDVFSDDDLKAAERDTPLVIVHSKSDPNVNWGMSQYAWERFSEEGWRAFKFLSPQQGGHMFARLPVGPAIRWLDVMTSDDAKEAQQYAAEQIRGKAWADAASALVRARQAEGGKASARTQELFGLIDAKAQTDAARFEKLIEKNADASWIDSFLDFRDRFQHAPCAQGAMQAFAQLRAEHQKPAEEAVKAARAAFRRGDQDGGYAKYQEVVDSHYASTRYRQVKRWIAERK